MTIPTKARAAALLTALLVAAPLAQANPSALDIANLPCSPTCPEELGLAPSEAPPTGAPGKAPASTGPTPPSASALEHPSFWSPGRAGSHPVNLGAGSVPRSGRR